MTAGQTYFLIGADDVIHPLPADKNVMIGRSAVNQIVLNDRLVSRVHASIAPSPKGPRLTDRGSANGVFVNGLPAQEPVLRHGDSVRIGKMTFHVFAGPLDAAQKWVARRKTETKSGRTLTELNVNQVRATDMIGDLSAFHLVSLLQTLVDQHQNGALTLSESGEWAGKIYFVNGGIVYAEAATGLRNNDAFFELLAMARGQFVFQPGVKPPTLGIMENAAALLLEGCRRMDERRGQPVGIGE